MSERIHKVMYGNTERMCFSQIPEVLPIRDLLELQKESYAEFISKGMEEVFKDFSPIVDFSSRMELHFLECAFVGESKYDEEQCKDRDATFARPLKVKTRLIFKETGEAIDQEVFMGDFPLMTENGSFIINGAERVVVSQLVRSPSVYCDATQDKGGKFLYETTVIPNRGAWLEFKTDSNNILWVQVDRTRKLTATVLLRALGFGTDEELLELFHNDPVMKATIEKDTSHTTEEAKIELYRRLRPGEVPTIEGVNVLINNFFFDAKRYDINKVGRYKFNKKLSLAARIAGRVVAEDVVSPDGEILATKGEVLTEEVATSIQESGVNEVAIDSDAGVYYVRGNNMVHLASFVDVAPLQAIIDNDAIRDDDACRKLVKEYVYYPTLKKLLDEYQGDELYAALQANVDELIYKHILIDDIIATVNYTLSLNYGLGSLDNIDHLANRRVRSVGELLQAQFRLGISRLERVIKERMSITQEISEVTPQTLINIRPVTSAIKEFFGSSQLSQFMDQSNPIAELTHKRKLSALGPGGLNRERAGVEVRDVHHSHYGRMCPIETPEGQNIGLISSLSTFAKVNEYGFIESPYRKVDKATGKVTDIVEYLDADEEDKYIVAQANEPIAEDGTFVHDRVNCRYREAIKEFEKKYVDYMDVSPRQLISVATSLIPFLENDDINRALMGSNMQRQAVPLLRPQNPIVATGMERKVAVDSGVMVISKQNGVIESVCADKIVVRDDEGISHNYRLQKFRRSNQGFCITQRPLVVCGQQVKVGDILADGPSTDQGELALGRNILVAFMTWEGYNYEDAILISEDLVKDDVFTSIHIEEYETEARDTRLGDEQITRDIPNLGDDVLRNLDEDGIVRIGAEVRSGDILVGKVTPKGEAELTPEERLLRAIFGEKAREVRDTSLRVPHGEGGIVVDVKIFTRANKDELGPGVKKLVRVYIAQKRKISVGDKMAGRHGNKGVISRVLPREDMPFMADGTPIQIVLNPLGVPSRMNIGQVLEVHLGLVAKLLGWKVATPVFDGASEHDIKELFVNNNLPADGKIQLYDGRSGEPFENRVTVGYMYMLKLCHLVADKIHARSTGPYSLVTQQPLGGKAQFGGQRFGEMEVWALEAYGAANILQEILTVKSDDVVGRVKTYESIVKGNNISEPGVPESFKVLIKELQSLALDVRVLTDKHEEIGLKDILDDDIDVDIRLEKEPEAQEVAIPEGDKGEDLFDFDDAGDDVFGNLLAGDDDELPEGFSTATFEDTDLDDDFQIPASGLFDGLFDEDAEDTDAE